MPVDHLELPKHTGAGRPAKIESKYRRIFDLCGQILEELQDTKFDRGEMRQWPKAMRYHTLTALQAEMEKRIKDEARKYAKRHAHHAPGA